MLYTRKKLKRFKIQLNWFFILLYKNAYFAVKKLSYLYKVIQNLNKSTLRNSLKNWVFGDIYKGPNKPSTEATKKEKRKIKKGKINPKIFDSFSNILSKFLEVESVNTLVNSYTLKKINFLINTELPEFKNKGISFVNTESVTEFKNELICNLIILEWWSKNIKTHTDNPNWYDEKGEEELLNYKKGMELETVILAIDPERERISLGIKQLDQDPFQEFLANNEKNSVVKGTVKEVDAKGAVISLADGIEGYLVPCRTSQPIVEKLERLLDEPELISVLSQNALRRSKEFTVGRYADRLFDILENLTLT